MSAFQTYHISCQTLETIIENREKPPLSLSAISSIKNCRLGHWIDQQNASEKSIPRLHEAHVAFHRLAGEVIAAYELQLFEKCEQKLLEFRKASEKVINILQQME